MSGETTSTPANQGNSVEIKYSGSRYKVIDRIGSGGQACVDLAIDTTNGVRVALKLPHDNQNYLSGGYFDREHAILRTLSQHTKQVPQLYDFQRSPPYLAMHFIPGKTIYAKIEDKTIYEQYSLDERVAMIAAVCAPLTAAHMMGIIHRDIKPDNILLSDDKELYLIDWALAKKTLETIYAPNETPFSGQSDGTQVVGTLRYCPPEQLDGSCTLSSDVYSLGAVLYELAAKRPFRNFNSTLNPAQRIRMIKAANGFITYVKPAVPAGLLSILEKAYSPKQRTRFANAYEFGFALNEYLNSTSPHPPSGKNSQSHTNCTPEQEPCTLLAREPSTATESVSTSPLE
ncbi:serine/threonine protein kinase [Candidatus Woesearchaeota archaeon]|nr:serine/threonine protein kinase [Candidatus Woesearchaeota archaeon]